MPKFRKNQNVILDKAPGKIIDYGQGRDGKYYYDVLTNDGTYTAMSIPERRIKAA
jgi:hypothetical protein